MKNLLYKLIIYILIICIIVSLNPSAASAERSLIKPLLYPIDTVNTDQPIFLWNDIYNTDKKNLFKLVVKETSGADTKTESFIFEPAVYYKYYFAYRLPKQLSGNAYEYTIEMLSNMKPVKYNYYNYLKYPITEKFLIKMGGDGTIDRLPSEYLIQYKFIEKENMLVNGYNVIFYGASSTLTLGLGFMLYTIFNVNMITAILSYLCFGTSIIGYTAAGYYGYHYMAKKSEMNEIVKLGGKTTIKGAVDQKNIKTGIELSF